MPFGFIIPLYLVNYVVLFLIALQTQAVQALESGFGQLVKGALQANIFDMLLEIVMFALICSYELEDMVFNLIQVSYFV
ncbi:hypothetical protein SAMN05443246_0265 [Paenibacillus sp. GP183]|jgi:hypothetical protein|nr:hypothetical protein SAMN05443246_0265 [Paenibacillus sp. GP183]